MPRHARPPACYPGCRLALSSAPCWPVSVCWPTSSHMLIDAVGSKQPWWPGCSLRPPKRRSTLLWSRLPSCTGRSTPQESTHASCKSLDGQPSRWWSSSAGRWPWSPLPSETASMLAGGPRAPPSRRSLRAGRRGRWRRPPMEPISRRRCGLRSERRAAPPCLSGTRRWRRSARRGTRRRRWVGHPILLTCVSYFPLAAALSSSLPPTATPLPNRSGARRWRRRRRRRTWPRR